MTKQPLIVEFPTRGVDRSQPLWRQPERTTYDCLNVLPFDRSVSARFGGGTRPPLVVNLALDAGNMQRLHWIANPASPGTSRIIGVQNGSIYSIAATYGAPPTYVKTLLAAAALAATAVSSADVNGSVYLVDGGANIKAVNASTLAVTNLAATTAVALPAAVKLACNFMGRLVLGGQSASPQNLYFSRALDPGDHDNSQQDALAAVALNSSSSIGRIGDPVVTFFPVRGDRLVIGCRNSIYILEGNPADGGRLLQVAGEVGMWGKDSYCVDENGLVYFVGNNALHVLDPVTHIVRNLSSGRVDHLFASLDSAYGCKLTWDASRQGCWIFAESEMFYRAAGEADGFFPMQIGAAGAISNCIVHTFDTQPDIHAILIGAGATGFYVMTDDPAGSVAETDIGPVAITSYFWMVVRPFPDGVGTLTRMHFWLHEVTGLTFNLDWGLYATKDETDLFASSAKATGNYTTNPESLGYVAPKYLRIRGHVFGLKFSNATANTTWFFQRAILDFKESGRSR